VADMMTKEDKRDGSRENSIEDLSPFLISVNFA